MIYTVALHTPARMLTIEADRFYVDSGFLVFTSGGGEDYGSNGGRPAGFPVSQVVFVTAESAVHTHRVYPNPAMMEPRLIDEEELARARQQLSYAPAIRSSDTTAPRVPAFHSPEVPRPFANGYGGTMEATSSDRGASFLGYESYENIPPLTSQPTGDMTFRPRVNTNLETRF